MTKISTYINTFEEVKNASYSNRIAEINIIKDLRLGDSFKHFKRRFVNYSQEYSPVSDEDMKKQFHSMNDMDTVINKLVSYCPDIDVFVPRYPFKKGNRQRAREQQKLVKRFLKKIKWKTRLNTIYDDLESKGDSFWHIYFNSTEPNMPLFKYLSAENVTDIILDRNGEPEAYIYRETVVDIKLTTNLSPLQSKAREVIWVFRKGETLIYDPMREIENGTVRYIKDDYGNQLYNVERVINKESYADKIAIVRFASFLRDGDEFSKISAGNYVEHCLTLDKITSNILNINMMLGHPTIHLLDCKLVKGERKPGGVFYYKSDEGKEGKIIDIQIKNDLKSWFEAEDKWLDALYDKVGLVNKSVELKLGSSDSSRVLKQLNSPMENKIALYVDNILEAMALPIEILLKQNNLWDDELDYGVTLKRPDFIIKTSEFDLQLFKANRVTSREKTLEEVMLENGDDLEEIELRKKELEKVEQSSDVSNENIRSNNNI